MTPETQNFLARKKSAVRPHPQPEEKPSRADALAEGRRLYQERIAAGEIERKAPRTPYERLAERPKSKALAIVAMCCNCMGWGPVGERPPGVINEIRNCTSPLCPLFAVRPYQVAGDDGDEDAEILEDAAPQQ